MSTFPSTLILSSLLIGLSACGTLTRRETPPQAASRPSSPIYTGLLAPASNPPAANSTASAPELAPADAIASADASPSVPLTPPVHEMDAADLTVKMQVDPNAPPPPPVAKKADDLQIVLKGSNGKATVSDSGVAAAATAIDEALDNTAIAGEATAANEKPLPKVAVNPNAVPADKALLWLKNGNRRFTKGYFRKDGQSKKDRARLVNAQTPHSIFLSCSDSRMPPELVFDQKLGEVFVVRNAGPSLDAATITSLEYGAESLGAQLLVVLSHPACELPISNVGKVTVNPARRPASALSKEETWNYVKFVADDLQKKSPLLARAVEKGLLKIQVAVYDLQSGTVDFGN